MDKKIPTAAELNNLATTLAYLLRTDERLGEPDMEITWTGGLFVPEEGRFWFTTIDNTSMPYRAWVSSDLEESYETFAEVLEAIGA